MNLIRDTVRTLLRFIVLWLVDTASLLLTAALIPGIGFRGNDNVLVVATAAAFLLGLVNFLIRPLILLLALPFGFIAIFGVGFFLNAVALLITAALVPSFYVSSWLDGFLGSLLLAALNTLLTSLIAVDDDDSFYQNLAERLAQREAVFSQDGTQGVVMIEIDGLSYHHIKKALAGGWMPTLKKMMDEEGYVLSRFDCGLPSQTSACQAGIMFGDNYDIPAFRWYDKQAQKLLVSSRDAPLLNARYAKGKGLMRAGSSVNNMLNGDARLSILTLADLFEAPDEEQQQRARDIYLVMLNPYFFLRTLVLYSGDVVREVYEGLRQQILRQAPRLNRLAHFYPLLRAATTVLMRDLSAYLTMLDIVRGTPALYMTWPGYDEVAHHSGPWTKDAFHTLRQYDHVISRVRHTIERKAPRPYELIILSDHGQSYGWTFKQRYGQSLQELIQGLLPQGTTVTQTVGGDDGMVSVSAMAMELDNIQRRNMGGRIGRRVVRGAQRAVERGVQVGERGPGLPAPEDTRNRVVVCGSGNLAQVYLTRAPERLKLEEWNSTYPGLVDALVRHPGIGLVMAYNDADEAIAFGKDGAHNVHTGAVVGTDPLALYGEPTLRAAQLKRIADFPNNGDLTIISTFYPDGTVAAMEELVGNHGGLGGEQTDAFLFHPPTFQVPPTSNSADVFQILDARRGLVVEPREPKRVRQTEAWSPRALWLGLVRVRKWVPVAARAVVLDRWAFRQAAYDPYMTGPALLITGVTTLLLTLVARGGFDAAEWGTRLGSWFVSVVIALGAARLVGGKSDFTTTLRAVGFAQTAFLLEGLTVIPLLAGIAGASAFVLAFLGTWIGVTEAHKLHGWRTLLFPVLMFALGFVGVALLDILLRGTELSLFEVGRALGIVPR